TITPFRRRMFSIDFWRRWRKGRRANGKDNRIISFFSFHNFSLFSYLISGYPRNMNDLGLYLERIGRVDGVVFINWHEVSLQHQIRYGASIGQIEEDLALAEFENFKSCVIAPPTRISGDRKPDYVYEDFENCVRTIRASKASTSDDNNALLGPRPITAGSYRYFKNKQNNGVLQNGHNRPPALHEVPDTQKIFRLIYIIGGPGSTKMNIVRNALKSELKDWYIIGTGDIIFRHLSERSSNEEEDEILKDLVRNGESFPD
ncbi:Adenylate kinase isoenzyme 5like, partial [Caligus rogercresseyi]